MKKPLVSVIIPSFNRIYFLIEAIRSVLEQTYNNLEIIVINDGSDEDLFNVENIDDEYDDDF